MTRGPGSGAEVFAGGENARGEGEGRVPYPPASSSSSSYFSSSVNGLPWQGVPAKGARRLARTLRKAMGLCLFLAVATFSFFLVSFHQGAGIRTQVIFSVHHDPDYVVDTLVPSVNASPSSSHSSPTSHTEEGAFVGTSESHSEGEEQKEKGFLVRTPGCIIPDFDPFHHTISRFISKPVSITCRGPPPLTSSRGTTLYYHQEVLRDNRDLYLSIYEKGIASSSSSSFHPTVTSINTTSNASVNSEGVSTNSSDDSSSRPGATVAPPTNATCCYNAIYRVEQQPEKYNGAADSRWKYSESCRRLTGPETAIGDEAIVVYCRMRGVLVYKNVHYFIQPSRVQRTPPEGDGTRRRPEGAEALSVIVFGTDSASRLNMRRHLPETYRYLTEALGAVELLGYNKVGDNTFPNLVPVLSGLSGPELLNSSCVPKKEKFDLCDWIWKDFKRNGYVTAILEDSPWMGCFHYMHNGFVTKPTDYYGRPFFMASEKEIGNSYHGNSNVCQGHKFSIKVVQDYSLEVARAFRDRPTFGVYWSASVSHDYLNLLRHADLPHLRYLKELREAGALNRTAVLFMSDHGMRFGGIRSTYIGMLEERLPYLMLYLPPWFRKKYHQAFRNLRTNARRLAANFDVYETLHDLAYGRFANLTHVTSGPPRNARGISLFREIPRARTCVDAGIPEHYCTCQDTREVTLDDPVLGMAVNYLKMSLNDDLRPYPACAQFKEARVLTGRVSGSNKKLRPRDKTSEVRSYLVQASLSPGQVVVEATVIYNPHPVEVFQLAGEVSRINEYGNSSYCMHHSILRKFCACKEQLPIKQQQQLLNGSEEQRNRSQQTGAVPTS